MDLSFLIHPFRPETFKQEYWEKKPLVIHRQQSDYYQNLLSLADVDRILSLSSIQPSQIRVVRAGKEMPIGGGRTNGLSGTAGRLEELYAAYRDGSTIVLQFLHERWKPLRRLAQSLAVEFSVSPQVNVYLTPAQEQGLKVHYDSHDVFVLQSEGAKHWRLYEGPIRLPLNGQPYDARTMAPGSLLDEFDLSPGDLLYIPRGCMHEAVSCDSTSLHLTVGMHTATWASVLLRAVEAVIERDSRFRESLPPGFAKDECLRERAEAYMATLVALLGEQIEAVHAIEEAAQTANLGRQPALDGHILDLQDLSRVDVTTRVRRQPEAEWRLLTGEESVSLYLHGKVVELPAHTWRALSFIAEAGDFTAADVPGDLDGPGKLTLVRTLIREGFLTICRSSVARE